MVFCRVLHPWIYYFWNAHRGRRWGKLERASGFPKKQLRPNCYALPRLTIFPKLSALFMEYFGQWERLEYENTQNCDSLLIRSSVGYFLRVVDIYEVSLHVWRCYFAPCKYRRCGRILVSDILYKQDVLNSKNGKSIRNPNGAEFRARL